MFGRNNKVFGFTLVITDFLTLLAAFSVAYILRVNLDHRPLLTPVPALDYFLSFLLIVPIWLMIFAALGLYSRSVYEDKQRSVVKVFLGCTFGILLLIAYEYIAEDALFPARLVPFYALAISFLAVIFARAVVIGSRNHLVRKGKIVNRTLIIGSDPILPDFIAGLLAENTHDYSIVGIAAIDDNNDGRPDSLKRALKALQTAPEGSEAPKSVYAYKSLQDAVEGLKRHKIDTIIQTNLSHRPGENRLVLRAAEEAHVNFAFIPGEPEFYSAKNALDFLSGYPLIMVSPTPLIGWSVIFKRVFDLLAVLISLPIWVPVLLLTVLGQKLFNPGPIFYPNVRLKRYGKKFNLFKFRSMNIQLAPQGSNAVDDFRRMGRLDLVEQYQKSRKIKNDPRVTSWFGRFIRKTSLDELSQIINVIKGDMSLVGPRPILPDELHFYESEAPVLLSVQPGITGLWQVSGRSDTSFAERVRLELIYASEWSFALDVKILAKTIPAVVSKRGAV